jgi:hypothetical protein
MMKKLMVLSLVMAIGAVTSAGLVYQINGVNYEPGSEVIALGDVEVVIFNTSEIIGSPTIGGVTSSAKISAATVYDERLPGSWSVTDFTEEYGVYLILQDFPDVVHTPVGALFSFMLTGVAEGDTFQMLDGNWDVLLPAITFIPEPMTMGLLGVGALFLRRRK